MKFSKLFGVICASLVATTALADQTDAVVSINSTGPDCYADGTKVLDGEYYALVWVKTGSVFAGFTADAKAVDPTNNEVICAVPAAKNGCCSDQNFELSSAKAYGYLSSGSLRLVVLDTRIPGTNGADKVVGDPQTSGVVGYGEIQGQVAGSDQGSMITVTSGTNTMTAVASAVPADAPQPVIKSITVKDGKVYVTVEKTVPYLQYNLSAGADAKADVNPKAAAKPVAGNKVETITLEADASDGSKFFKVIRDQNN